MPLIGAPLPGARFSTPVTGSPASSVEAMAFGDSAASRLYCSAVAGGLDIESHPATTADMAPQQGRASRHDSGFDKVILQAGRLRHGRPRCAA